jgi:DNA-binding CsgD family transcriptional regulator
MNPSLSPHSPPMLVGRDRERAVLRDALDAAMGGQGNLVLIGGEAGIGKTALAETVGREAEERGALVLVGRCFDLTETPPYGPWVELFATYAPAPDLPPLPTPFATHGTVGAVESQTALFTAVHDFFSALSQQQPLVLLLDDLHWTDPASLALLRFLARAVARLPLLLLVAYRADELTRRHPLSQLLPLLVRESHAARLDLNPLSTDDVRVLVQTRYQLADAGAEPLITYLTERSDGNALFIGELLRTIETQGAIRNDGAQWSLGDLAGTRVPTLLRQVIDRRVGYLDGESQRLLAVAAVIGQVVPLDVWAVVGEVDEDTLLDVTERAEEARLLIGTADGAGVQFAHALIREALYEGLPSVRRRRLHRTVGAVLAEGRHPDPDAIAWHFSQCGDARAVQWLIRAGERAQAALAWPTAVQRYEAALADEEGMTVEERGWLLYRIARLLRQTDHARGLRYAQEAEDVAQIAGNPPLVIAARYGQGHILYLNGDYAAGAQIVWSIIPVLDTLTTEEIALIDQQDPTTTVTDMRGFAILIMATLGHYAEARAMIERAPLLEAPPDMPMAGLSDEPWRAIGPHGYYGLAALHDNLGHFAEAREAYARTCLLAGIHHQVIIAWSARFFLVSMILHYAPESRAEARVLVDEAETVSERAAGTVMSDRRGMVRALPDVVEGRWDAAERILDIAPVYPAWWGAAMGPYGYLKRARGGREAVWERLRQGLPEGAASEPGTRPLAHTREALQVGAMLLLDTGDTEQAREWIDALSRWLAWSGAIRGQSACHALWAHYYRQIGQRDDAYTHAQQALAYAAEPRQPFALLVAHRLLGELSTAAGRYDDAAGHLDASLRLADACAAPYERALTLLAMTELHAATSASEPARTLLDEARAICEPLGAMPALARADALAAQLNATPSAPLAYPAGLSAREVEVLRLVTEGLSNPQIAERLFLSPRTVEQHLRAVYNKTGVPSRTAAVRWATDHGLT